MAEKLMLVYVIVFYLLRQTVEEAIWMRQGQETLQAALERQRNEGVARNVILFLGDGMGVSTLTAARIYKGQKQGKTGEETRLNFEEFPHVALSKTYSVDAQVSDSAATGTAFLSGEKANKGTLGVDARVKRKQCQLVSEGSVETILDWAMAADKWVGIVTTARVTHATPAALYAHTPERDWESDGDMEDADSDCKSNVQDIASQLIDDEENKNIRVILGGGRRNFYPNTALDADYPDELNEEGRKDGRDLIQTWKADKATRGFNASYVRSYEEFDAINVDSTDFLLGLMHQSHMLYELERWLHSNDTAIEPSLAEMVKKAVGILSKNPQGFFLLVEGGRIDHAHHANKAHLALSETLAFDDAVAVAKEMTGEDTLLVVTADHSHVFTIAGYPERGHDILGVHSADQTDDGMPYATLSYANGPGPQRIDLTGVDTKSKDHRQSALVPMSSETHGGEDVAIFARGPMAHLFHGLHEQNYIAHVMGYAACVGPNTQHCNKTVTQKQSSGASSTRMAEFGGLTTMMMAVLVVALGMMNRK